MFYYYLSMKSKLKLGAKYFIICCHIGKDGIPFFFIEQYIIKDIKQENRGNSPDPRIFTILKLNFIDADELDDDITVEIYKDEYSKFLFTNIAQAREALSEYVKELALIGVRGYIDSYNYKPLRFILK